MVDISALRTELSTDPIGIGYATELAKENPDYSVLAALLNDATGTGASWVAATEHQRFEVRKLLIPATRRLARGVTISNTAIDAQTQNEWTQVLDTVRSGETPIAIDADVISMLGELETAGILSTAERYALEHKKVSRAELLFGTEVTNTDVGRAIWNDSWDPNLGQTGRAI